MNFNAENMRVLIAVLQLLFGVAFLVAGLRKLLAREFTPAARALAGPDSLVRTHAAWALGRIGGPEAAEALELARVREHDGEVIDEIEMALAESA